MLTLRLVAGFGIVAALMTAGLMACDPNAACKEAKDCKAEGKCTADEAGKCIAGSDQDCAASDGCRVKGQCSVVDGRCQAKNDADCQKSEGCSKEGKCGANEGLCSSLDTIFHEACEKECRSDGLCVQKDGKCVALSKYHCYGSPSEEPDPNGACAKTGRCTAKDGKCTAASDDDCKKSKGCEKLGQCVAKDGRCVPVELDSRGFEHDGRRLVFASNRNGKVPGETNVFIAEWR